MLLKIKNLSVGYNHKTILENINLQAKSGDFIILIGKNGAGKSTLIKTIAGITTFQKGKILIDNSTFHKLNKKTRAKYIGIVLTDQIKIELNVYEFISLGRQTFTGYFDTLSEKDKKKINQTIQQLNLQNIIDKKINELSDGERQKTLIARALVQETPIILLDEPTAHLDLENKAMIFNLLKDLAQKEKKIIIISTHDINLILPITKKIWLVKEKKIIETNNKPNELFKLFDTSKIKYDTNCQIFRIT